MKQTFEFEGQQRTRAEIMSMVPAIKSWETVKKQLDAGKTTRREVLSYDPNAAMRAGGRRGYAKTNTMPDGVSKKGKAKCQA